MADTQEDSKREAVEHFYNFLTYTPPVYTGVSKEELKDLLQYDCSEEDRNMLMKEVTTEEIRKVVFFMARDKSPGPDGNTSEFFKSNMVDNRR